ncbi:MAG: redoxin family protein [Brevirhabdus sp.]
MTIAVGDRLPDAIFVQLGEEGPINTSVQDLTKGRKVVIFGLPGAYTSTCSIAHLPSFMRTREQFAAKGVEEVICVTVNDPHVTKSWGETTGATEAGVVIMADPTSDFTKAIGMEFSVPEMGFFDRSRRYAMVVEGGVVTVLNEEPGRGCSISTGEELLEAMV